MTEQALDLRTGTAILRRQWRALAAVAAAGLVLGATYAVVVPPRKTSTALVLLPQTTSSSDTSKVSATQTTIATSQVVLDRAGRKLTPALTAQQVRGLVDVSAPTDQLLQIDAHAETADRSQAVAQAVADSYVYVVTEMTIAGISSQTRELQTRQQSLTTQLNSVTNEIKTTTARIQVEGANSSGGLKDGQAVAQLRNQQANLSLTLDQVRSALDSAQALQSGNSQTKVVQPAAPASSGSLVGRLVVDVPLAALAPTVLLGFVLLLRGRRDPRLRAQDRLADAVDSRVVGTLDTTPQKSAAQWSTLLAGYEAGPVEEWALRRALHALALAAPPGSSAGRIGTGGPAIEHPRSVLVVSLTGDDRSLAVGPQLAAFTASRGIGTRLVAAAGADHAPELWAACAAEREAEIRPNLSVDKVRAATGAPPGGTTTNDAGAAPTDTTGDAPEASAPAAAPPAPAAGPPAAFTVVLVVVDPEQPAFQGVPSTAVTVLAVSPGTATRVSLARVAVALDDVGRAVDGVIVAHPDPDDVTTGHRTLRQRVRQTPLPVRLTGLGSGVPIASETERATT